MILCSDKGVRFQFGNGFGVFLEKIEGNDNEVNVQAWHGTSSTFNMGKMDAHMVIGFLKETSENPPPKT